MSQNLDLQGTAGVKKFCILFFIYIGPFAKAYNGERKNS